MNMLGFKRNIFLISICVFVFGCGEASKKGADIPKSVQVNKLADILTNPADYKGKNVLIEGNFSACCGDDCGDEFNIKEGTYVIKAETEGFEIPKMTEGQPIRVYGTLMTTAQSPYIEALALELRK